MTTTAAHGGKEPAFGIADKENMATLLNKTALVTGASRGMGRATAAALAAAGAHVLVHYGRSVQEAASLVGEIRSKEGRADAIHADLGTPAGIWDRWKGQSANLVQTCSILTTGPNALTGAIHDRMPVILDASDFDLWLDPGMKNVAEALQLLKPYDAQLMRCFPVSHRVNNVINDDDACSEQVNPAIVQDRLFS